MIQYRYPWPEAAPTLRVPVLHKVNYNPAYTHGEIYYWLKENCRAPFYTGPSWTDTRFVEFEDDRDATAFAMRWS